MNDFFNNPKGNGTQTREEERRNAIEDLGPVLGRPNGGDFFRRHPISNPIRKKVEDNGKGDLTSPNIPDITSLEPPQPMKR